MVLRIYPPLIINGKGEILNFMFASASVDAKEPFKQRKLYQEYQKKTLCRQMIYRLGSV